jgi:RHS repeat-associated protein
VRPHATTGLSGGPLGSQSFFYDANGSMTCQGGSGPTCPGGDNRRDYDGENRLVTAVDGTYTTSITYGPDGARLRKAVAVAGGGTTTTLYFGDDVELTAGQYLKYLPGDVKKVGSGAGGTLYWQHRDHLQSVRVVTKGDGTKDDGATYRPYGEQLGFAGTTPQTKGFINQRLDDESGLMYLHARYYDPQLGRFIQADPSDPTAMGVGVNRYAYAGDNPVGYLDQTGLALTQGPLRGSKEERDVQLAAGEEPGEGGGWAGFAKDRELNMTWTYDKLAKEKVPFPPYNEENYQHYRRSIELREELLNKGTDPLAVNNGNSIQGQSGFPLVAR